MNGHLKKHKRSNTVLVNTTGTSGDYSSFVLNVDGKTTLLSPRAVRESTWRMFLRSSAALAGLVGECVSLESLCPLLSPSVCYWLHHPKDDVYE